MPDTFLLNKIIALVTTMNVHPNFAGHLLVGFLLLFFMLVPGIVVGAWFWFGLKMARSFYRERYLVAEIFLGILTFIIGCWFLMLMNAIYYNSILLWKNLFVLVPGVGLIWPILAIISWQGYWKYIISLALLPVALYGGLLLLNVIAGFSPLELVDFLTPPIFNLAALIFIILFGIKSIIDFCSKRNLQLK